MTKGIKDDLIRLLSVLGIAIVINLLCSTYYEKEFSEIVSDFNIKYLLYNLYKILIIIVATFGLAYIFQIFPELSEYLGVKPKFILISAINIYSGKALLSFGRILGVDIKLKNNISSRKKRCKKWKLVIQDYH